MNPASNVAIETESGRIVDGFRRTSRSRVRIVPAMDDTSDSMVPLRIAIVSSTRPGQLNETVAHWVLALARRRGDMRVARVDVSDQRLRFASSTAQRPDGRALEHLRAWSSTVAAFDGFVFVTPEYNEASAAVMKQAIRLVAPEWRSRPVGFVGYGAEGAMSAVEDLRRALAQVGAATVGPEVALTLVPGYWSRASFVPDARHAPELNVLLDRVASWARALQTVRTAVCRRDEATPAVLAMPPLDAGAHAP